MQVCVDACRERAGGVQVACRSVLEACRWRANGVRGHPPCRAMLSHPLSAAFDARLEARGQLLHGDDGGLRAWRLAALRCSRQCFGSHRAASIALCSQQVIRIG